MAAKEGEGPRRASSGAESGQQIGLAKQIWRAQGHFTWEKRERLGDTQRQGNSRPGALEAIVGMSKDRLARVVAVQRKDDPPEADDDEPADLE